MLASIYLGRLNMRNFLQGDEPVVNLATFVRHFETQAFGMKVNKPVNQLTTSSYFLLLLIFPKELFNKVNLGISGSSLSQLSSLKLILSSPICPPFMLSISLASRRLFLFHHQDIDR